MNVRVTNMPGKMIPAKGSKGIELDVQGTVVTADISGWGLADYALVSFKNADVLVTFDGTNPTNKDAGILYPKSSQSLWRIARLEAAKFIKAGDDNATVRIEAFVEA